MEVRKVQLHKNEREKNVQYVVHNVQYNKWAV